MSMSSAIPRSNNFDILRLIFASMVVLYHCYDLSGEGILRWVPLVCSAKLAVEGFFAMSGCLIVASYEASGSLTQYIEKRARRILPAYWAAFLLSMVIGVCFTSLPLGTFLRSFDTWKFALANLSFLNFLHPSLPGLFMHNPVMDSVNGSLWTIKIEIMFYLFVPALVFLCNKCGRWQTLLTIFLLSLVYKSICEQFHHDSFALQLPAQLGFFVVGASVYYYYSWFREHKKQVWIIAVSAYIAYFSTNLEPFGVLGVSLLVMCCGLLLPDYMRKTKSGDLSYGVYVFHFPIIQLFLMLGIFHAHPLIYVVAIAFIVGILSFASWHLVEKRWLLRPRANDKMMRTVMTGV